MGKYDKFRQGPPAGGTDGQNEQDFGKTARYSPVSDEQIESDLNRRLRDAEKKKTL